MSRSLRETLDAQLSARTEPPDPWRALSLKASAEVGRTIPVLPGGKYAYASAGVDGPFSSIHLPEQLVNRRAVPVINGLLAHEILHARLSEPAAIMGLSTAEFIVANSLEDLRIESRSVVDRRGDVEAIQPLLMSHAMKTAVPTQERSMAKTAEAMKLWQVSAALYLLLRDIAHREVKLYPEISEMALDVARVLLATAFAARQAKTTHEVVGLARRIIQDMARAAEQAAQARGTASARQWVTSFRTELQKAQSVPAERVLAILRQQRFPGQWFGPWVRSGGGYSFATVDWEWGDEEEDGNEDRQLTPLGIADLESLVNEADPVHYDVLKVERFLSGSLPPQSSALVRAAVGKDRRVFERSDQRFSTPILRALLCQTDVHLIIEGHGHYLSSNFVRMKSTAASLGRVFDRIARPHEWTMSAHHTTRAREAVENPVTKARTERWSNQFFCHLGEIKAADGEWTTGEGRLRNLPKEGFNQPFEAYPRLLSRLISGTDSTNKRNRLFLIVGDLTEFNVCSGYIGSCLNSLRGGKKRAIYVHVGRPLPSHYAIVREARKALDGVAVVSSSLAAGILDVLLTMLNVMVSDQIVP